jgi:hypothetical protein
MKSEITLLNIPPNKKVSIDKMLIKFSSVTFKTFEPFPDYKIPECIRLIIIEDSTSSEFVFKLNYNAELEAYDFYTINQTIFPEYQSVQVEVISDESTSELKQRFGYMIVLNEEDDGGVTKRKPKKRLVQDLVLQP